tara:strand:- start:237 stop:509 length:273 start_codon:yes stop_codon:yes gene_type:complete
MANDDEKDPMLAQAELEFKDAYEEYRQAEKEFGWALPGTIEGTRFEHARQKLGAADARVRIVCALLCQREHESQMAKLEKLAKSNGWELG